MKFVIILFLVSFQWGCSLKDKTGNQPLIVVVAGQSNAVGMGDASKSPSGFSNCFEYNSKLDLLIPIKDPVGQYHLNFDPASSGSFSSSLAFHLSELTNKKIIIVQCAKGGSALHPIAKKNNWGNWDESGGLLGNSFIKISEALLKINQEVYKNPRINAIIWSQGENDGEAIGNGILARDEYKNSLKKLISNFRNRYGAELPFLIVETGRNTSCSKCDDGFEIVRQVQREVAVEDAYTFIGYNETEYFGERNWMNGSVHYNQTGLNDIGEKLANFLASDRIIIDYK